MQRSNLPMHELRISFDPCNPGQFYACCGLIELFEVAEKTTASHFTVNRSRPRQAEFVLTSETELDMQAVVSSLKKAEYRPLSRKSAENPPAKDSIAPI